MNLFNIINIAKLLKHRLHQFDLLTIGFIDIIKLFK